MTTRTPAERHAEALSREVDQLRSIPLPTRAQADRLRKANAQLVSAWRVVNEGKR